MTSSKDSAPTAKAATSPTHRYSGLDLVRLIATVAVVLLHSGGGKTVPLTDGAIALRSYATFPVPVFLALSLYLSATRILQKGSLNLAAKLPRLLQPYAFFSAFYLLFYAIQGTGLRPAPYLKRLGELISSDLTGLIFFGQAATPLYFLPLLATGTVAMQLLGQWLLPASALHKKRAVSLFVAGLVSIVIYQLFVLSGNAFVLAGRNTAFQALVPTLLDRPLLRILLVYTAWLLWCVPYVFAAFFWALVPMPVIRQWGWLMAIATLIAFAVQPQLAGLDAVRDMLVAFPAIGSGLWLSSRIDSVSIPSQPLQWLSKFSFGIYLLHPAILYLDRKSVV